MNIRIYIIFIIFFLFHWGIKAQKQIKTDAPRNILEALSINEKGLGYIMINQPDYIRSLVETQNETGAPILSSDASVSIAKGYRIQVYNGNIPQSKEEVYNRADKIKNKFSNLGIYITYKAPFWRLLVGDFISEDEANNFMDSIVDKLPEYKREIYVVPSSIRLIYTNNVENNVE